MTNPETSPEVRREAERLATVARSEPEKFRGEVLRATLDQLNAFAELMEASREPVKEEVSAALEQRTLELMASKTTDERLVELEKRVSLASIADIQRPQEQEEPLTRKAQRFFYRFLSFFEGGTPQASAATGILGSFIPSFGFLNGIKSLMPNFARRNLMSMDIEDLIAKEQRIGESIVFAPLTSEEYERYERFLSDTSGGAKPSVQEMVQRLIASERERNLRKGTPRAAITVTIDGLMKNPASAEVTELQTQSRGDELKEAFDIDRVTEVRIGDIATFENGVLTVPEAELAGTRPISGSRTETMVRLLRNVSVTSVLVVPDGATSLEWSGNNPSLTYALASSVEPSALGALLTRGKPQRISVIRIANDDSMGIDTVRYSREGSKGVLSVPLNAPLITELATELEAIASSITDDPEQKWVLRNGAFVKQGPSVPVN